MTLVQNLLQRLSGNSFISIFLVGLIIGLSSCGSSKKTTRITDNTRPKKDQTVKENKPASSPTIDTVHWTIIGEDVRPPIGSTTGADKPLFLKNAYSVKLLIPFEAEKNTALMSSQKASTRFVNYYGGVQLALEALEAEGIRLQVEVHDTDRDEKLVKSKLDRFHSGNTDVVIGPYTTKSLKEAAKFAKDENIPVISPWRASSSITKKNPYYIQLRPNLNEHYRHILQSALEEYEADQIILVGRDDRKDKRRINAMQNEYKSLNTKKITQKLREFFVIEDSLRTGETAFDSIFYDDKTTVFIIPNHSSGDEDFIYSCLNRIHVEKNENPVVVYGMPIMYDSDKINFDLYRNLNLRICRSKFVDRTASVTSKFEKKYFEKYKDFPSKDAYEGYDMMLYFGRALHKYGSAFQDHLHEYPQSMMQTRYEIDRYFPNDGSFEDNYENFNYYQNKSLYIIQYVDGAFRKNS